MSDRGAALPRFARRPFAPAALALAVFTLVGVAVVDDYGVPYDEDTQRAIGLAAVNHVLGADTGVLPSKLKASDRYYGVAFEAPLILAERALGLTDSRAIYLSRHLLTHLFFLTGGWFCYLLTWRLFGDRWLALFALLLFLLHPRLYAHSFYNSKDLPFLAMFMIALYLMQRAFRRGTVAAFAACGVGVGVLINLRIMGLALFAAVPALRALDLALARGPAARRRALASAAAFVLAAAGTFYALSPYLWRDPFAIVDAVTTFARHPNPAVTLFQGEPAYWPWLPPHYVPTWMAITTPPATLLLCLIGAAAVVRRGSARPRSILRNTEARFAWLLLACLALPPAAAAALGSTLYNDWRHMYFLYAPLCLLAVYGLRLLLTLTAAPARPRLRRGIYALAAAALAGAAVDVVRLHPHQQAYFNFLVDRGTPERLRAQYQMLYWTTEYREGLESLLARVPEGTLYVDSTNPRLHLNRSILPAPARRRIVIVGETGPPADFFLTANSRSVIDHAMFGRMELPFGPLLHARRIYHNTVLAVAAVDLARVDQAAVDRYRAAYRAATAGTLLLRSEFDLYLDGRTLTWVKESCRPEHTVYPFLVRAVPVAAADLRPWMREEGWEPIGFRFGHYGVRFDGRCLIRRTLPGYPIRALVVGRYVEGEGAGSLLEAVIDLPAAGPAVSRFWQEHRTIAAGERGAPAARAAFDLYLDAAGTVLTYYRRPCAPEDLRAPFFLHLFPVDAAELDAGRGQSDFANRGFAFADRGVLLDGACVALAPLPAWDRGIARIRTGQYRGDRQLWNVELRPGGAGE